MSAFELYTTAELRAAGHTIRSIQHAIESGSLERVIKGWYATQKTDPEAVRAMRYGGRLGCASALRLHGAWVPPEQGMHLQLPSHASGRRMAGRTLPSDVQVHWHGKDDRTGSAFAVTPLDRSILQMLECQPIHFVIAILDSLLYRRRISRNRLLALLAQGPHRTRFLSAHLEPLSEEGVESVVRFGLAMAGIEARPQIVLRTGDRLDFRIGGWLGLEIDGRGTHAQAQSFTKDRVRLARVMTDGEIMLQFAYATVMYDFPFLVNTVQAVIAQHAPVGLRRA